MTDRWLGPLQRLVETRLGCAVCFAWVVALAATLAW